jgi:hypothetical protein
MRFAFVIKAFLYNDAARHPCQGFFAQDFFPQAENGPGDKKQKALKPGAARCGYCVKSAFMLQG